LSRTQESLKTEESKNQIRLQDLEALFGSGKRSYKRKEAVDELMDLTGKSKTACYEELNANGKFKTHINFEGSLLTLANPIVGEFPPSVSAHD
jgi:hypothetical protein